MSSSCQKVGLNCLVNVVLHKVLDIFERGKIFSKQRHEIIVHALQVVLQQSKGVQIVLTW